MPTTSVRAAQTAANPAEVLSQVFGFASFRKGQEDVIQRLLDDRSAVAIFPTGSGKSLCYQLPALMLDGLTVVISPLIALMKDQLDFLQRRNIAAHRLDSSLSKDEVIEVYRQLRERKTRLLYVSPERLGNERFLQLLEQQKIALLAVDEAHCISEWGHNFRPDYLRIADLAKRLSVERVLALTATATPEVATDIAQAFDIAPNDIIHTGFYRPNLQLHVSCCTEQDRSALLLERLKQRPRGPAIVYVTLQRTAEKVAAMLASNGYPARAYHAGMKPEVRSEVQEAFMGASDMIVVATIAFGMGIDKSDIRAVYHYNLPKSLEGYMQEIGRAGRDGKPAACEMLACRDDEVVLQNFTYGDTPTPEAVKSLVDEVLTGEQKFDVSVYHLSHRHDVRDLVVKTLLTYLELEGILVPTGPTYTEYKFQAHKSSQEILASFDAQRAAFLKSIFQAAKRGKIWFTIDVAEVSRSLQQPRERIVAALDYLDQLGYVTLQATGVRLGYQLTKLPADREELVARLIDRFRNREEQDLSRIRKVVDMAEYSGCLTRYLLEYFGEDRPDCNHCCRCSGTPAVPLPTSCQQTLSGADRKLIGQLLGEKHAALRSPRQVTRFLCGITSPAATRAKLRSRREFGKLDTFPFATVLQEVEQVFRSSR